MNIAGVNMTISEIAKEVIHLARVARAKVENNQDEQLLDWCYRLLRENRSPVENTRELRDYLLGQSVAVIYTLTLIMYVGRGDIRVTDFRVLYDRVRWIFPTSREAVNQMVEKAPLPDYLDKGLRLFAAEGIDADLLLQG
jgi:hypothetical protein